MLSHPQQKYFSVPPHTPIYLAEAGDCGCTLARLHCKDAAGPHESKLLQQHTPQWILDYVSRVSGCGMGWGHYILWVGVITCVGVMGMCGHCCGCGTTM